MFYCYRFYKDSSYMQVGLFKIVYASQIKKVKKDSVVNTYEKIKCNE